MLVIIALISLLAWIYLAGLHGRFWQPLLPALSPPPGQWPSVDIIVPARDEAAALPDSLASLLAQDYPGAWRIILVDDHSSDGTGHIARAMGGERVMVIEAPEPAPGWSGKLAAMNAGAAQSSADYILFTDADIKHPANNLRELVAASLDQKFDLNSQMVRLHCTSFAEKMLIPAFVFFFAMLYPFRWASDPKSKVAAAAGGVMLVKRAMLERIGGLARIKSELIDDCALAKAIKKERGRIELTFASDVESLRVYPEIKDVWKMIARTAYTQLRHSPLLLAGTVIGMGLLFLAPVLLAFSDDFFTSVVSLIAWLIMTGVYVPTVLFYRLPLYWAFLFPLAGVIYAAATINSARLYWQGKGGEWKGRTRGQGSGISIQGKEKSP